LSPISTPLNSYFKGYIDDKLKSQINVAYSYNSARPYDNPNTTEFMNSKTESYTNLSFSRALLLIIKITIHPQKSTIRLEQF
jgi:hypothetical protein